MICFNSTITQKLRVLSGIPLVLLFSSVFICMNVSYASDSNVSLEVKWAGLWKNVKNLNQIMPEEEPVVSVNVYDLLRITNVNENGFTYRNAGNDVGYGPNEVTYFQGQAVYNRGGDAVDKKNNVKLFFTQGEKKWDRGITLVSVGKIRKFFKQKRTVFEAGFNCDKAGTPIEKEICSQPVLARADREMGVLYRQLRKNLKESERSALRKKQRSWIKDRNKKCQDKQQADKVCLSAYYSLRLLQLRKQSNPEIGGDTRHLDAAYMNVIYERNAKIWEDTVFRLFMAGIKKEDALLEWKKYNPKIEAKFTDTEAVFTGKYQFQTIIWPNDVNVSKAFQIVVGDKSRVWLSISTGTGHAPETITYGSKPLPLSVMQWLDIQKQDKKLK